MQHLKSSIFSYIVCPFINQSDEGRRHLNFVSQYELSNLSELEFTLQNSTHSLGSYVYLLSHLGNNLAICGF